MMVTKKELLELITNSQNSSVDFKCDSVESEPLCKEICAICNEKRGGFSWELKMMGT